jgi:hypothetical protein
VYDEEELAVDASLIFEFLGLLFTLVVWLHDVLLTRCWCRCGRLLLMSAVWRLYRCYNRFVVTRTLRFLAYAAYS